MTSPKSNQQKFKFRKNIDIGSLAAEHDQMLLKCFFEKEETEILRDFSSQKTILIGRTGSGKSALLTYLEDKEPKVTRIVPEAMSLKYLSNSTILNYFRDLGINLDLFYKLLWKHVFIVELLKLHLGADALKTKNFLSSLHEKYIMNSKKKKALEYLRTWQDKFWENTEYRIKEIETNLETSFLNQLGWEDQEIYKGFKIGHTNQLKESESKKVEILHKAQNVINSIQVQEIYDIIEIMKSDLFKQKSKYYIIIDDLDTDWIDSIIVYDLIKGMILAINELATIPGSKIVIALRENINDIVFKKSQQGIQREKYNHLYMKIHWEDGELKEMLNNRLKELMKDHYSGESPTVEDIFPIGKKKDAFEYIIDRTFMRPRDVISFFNKCIEKADGRANISMEVIRQAEIEYSDERLKALEDEWFDNYGNLYYLYSFLKKVKKSNFMLSDLKEDDFIEFICQDPISFKNDKVVSIHKKYTADDFKSCVKEILIVLFRIGMIGIKNDPRSPTSFSYHNSNNKKLNAEDLNDEAKFMVHKMFLSALNIPDSNSN